jgi:hypothetical protein
MGLPRKNVWEAPIFFIGSISGYRWIKGPELACLFCLDGLQSRSPGADGAPIPVMALFPEAEDDAQAELYAIGERWR